MRGGTARQGSGWLRGLADVRLILGLGLVIGLSGCGGQRAHHVRSPSAPSRYYLPPGPSDDPWRPYIAEASGRFGVPERWIRRVMRQESGGQQDVTSWAGAMGLMQVMPDTYDDLRDRHRLGADPFDPHNNILAGTAYLREMYDRFGAPGFLAAYNAGPNRLDRYLTGGEPLPDETVNYVASIAPYLGAETVVSGPLSVYADRPVVMASRGGACDADAAYDPSVSCAPAGMPVREPAVQAAPLATASGCDPDAAFDPSRPCAPLEPNWAREPVRGRPIQQTLVLAAAPAGRWAIQVGAFANLTTAQAAAETARAVVPDLLRTASIVLPPTTPFGTQVAFRARLSGLSADAATDACARLGARGLACMTVPPG